MMDLKNEELKLSALKLEKGSLLYFHLVVNNIIHSVLKEERQTKLKFFCTSDHVNIV